MRDYYAILGVGEHASAQQIKTAFRKLCMQYHPDKTGGNKALEEKFRQILAVYEVLGDPARRQQYDQRRAWERAAARRPQPVQHRPQPSYPPPTGKSWSFQVNIQVPARLPKKAMITTAAVLVVFFVLLYFFGPQPRQQDATGEEGMITLPPSITAGLVPLVKDPNPLLVLPGRPAMRLADFLAGRDTVHSFVNMDADDVPELVAGGYLFTADNDGQYRLVFHYDGAMYVQQNHLFLYFNDLVGAYRSCYRCGVQELANDESIAEIRMVYDSGRVIFPEMDRRRAIAILENIEYLFKRGIPPVDAEGRDDGTRKELLRHFIAFHFNQRSMTVTAQLFARVYTEADRDVLWHDLQQMIGTLEKRITSATALNSYRG